MTEYIKKNWFVLSIITIIISIALLYVIAFIKKDDILNNSKFTVGTMTSNWHQKNNRGVGTDFIYFVNGMKISKTTHYDLKKGTKYLVMYDSLSPSWYIMIGHHQLPDSIEPPPNGWKFNEIPIPIDSGDLKQYFDELGID